jgi:hypothetical protein
MYKTPFEIDFNKRKCEAISCESRHNVTKLQQWNNPDIVNWYCERCFSKELEMQLEEKNKFIEYYKDPSVRAWLPPKSLELYNRLTNQT